MAGIAASRNNQSSSGLSAAPNEVGDSGLQWSCALASAGNASLRRVGGAAQGRIPEISPLANSRSTGPSRSRPSLVTPRISLMALAPFLAAPMQKAGRAGPDPRAPPC